ncbi:MAG: hypothetical protein NWS06_03065 [Candidatus Nanopelagicales bacterium]|jgi:hypothetical protein|nr:hypothetical protein [Candidatus Nanopelagicales bacterium]
MKTFMKVKRDEGSILLFGIGLAVTALMIATLAINVASLWVTRNVLDGIADGAALSAAQAIDTDAIYQDGLGASLRLNETLARNRVLEYVRVAQAAKQVEQFSIASVTVSGTSVTVTVQGIPSLPFGYLMPVGAPIVVSSAKAVNRVR